jgi:hypothetical protein
LASWLVATKEEKLKLPDLRVEEKRTKASEIGNPRWTRSIRENKEAKKREENCSNQSLESIGDFKGSLEVFHRSSSFHKKR